MLNTAVQLHMCPTWWHKSSLGGYGRISALRVGYGQSAADAIFVMVCCCYAAKRDELCPYPAAQAASSKAKQVTLVTLDCVHFQVYNKPWMEQAVAAQLDFIKQHGV